MPKSIRNRRTGLCQGIYYYNGKVTDKYCSRCNILQPIGRFRKIKSKRKDRIKYSNCTNCRKEEAYLKELLCLKYYKVPEELILLKKAHLTLKRELCQQL